LVDVAGIRFDRGNGSAQEMPARDPACDAGEIGFGADDG